MNDKKLVQLINKFEMHNFTETLTNNKIKEVLNANEDNYINNMRHYVNLKYLYGSIKAIERITLEFIFANYTKDVPDDYIEMDLEFYNAISNNKLTIKEVRNQFIS